MSVPNHADVIVLRHRSGPELCPGDLVPERQRRDRRAVPDDPGVLVATQVATYTGWQTYASTTIASTEIATRRSATHGSWDGQIQQHSVPTWARGTSIAR
jgi:hypothetical protein